MPLASGATLVPRPAGASLSGRDLHAFLRDAPRHGAVLRPEHAGHPRGGPARPAVPAGGRGGLPSGADQAVAQARPAVPERLRPGRGDGVGHLDRAAPGQAGRLSASRCPPTARSSWTPTTRTTRCRTGEVGEIGIAGIGLACGYLNRDDLTEQGVHPGLPGHPGEPVRADLPHRRPGPGQRRTGRSSTTAGSTGRTGRAAATGTELGEIESALLRTPQIPAPRQPVDLPVPQAAPLPVPQAAPLPVPQAVQLPVPQPVAPPVPQAVQLPVPQPVAPPVPQAVALPVPQAVQLPVPQPVAPPVPQASRSGAAGRAAAVPRGRRRRRPSSSPCPRPSRLSGPWTWRSRRLRPPAPCRRPASKANSRRCWPRSWAAEQVPVDAHFFDDLGADSMLMARFCARLRKRDDLPAVVDEGRLPAPDHPEPGHRLRARDDHCRRRALPPRSPRCWPRSWAASRSRSTATSSTTWAPTRW